MLEKLPHFVGEKLQGKGPGLDKTIYFDADLANAPETITISSPALTNGQPIPARYTEDGEKLSPPLSWSGVPAGATHANQQDR